MTLIEPRWDEARAFLAEAAVPLPAKTLPIPQCDRHVLDRDLVALCPLPSFDTSAMDGWAVSGSGPWQLVGESLAGGPPPPAIGPGEALTIATGAIVPDGADAVIRSEEGRLGRDRDRAVLFAEDPDGPTYVRPRAEECVTGDLLAAAGTAVTPALLGLAAAAGHDRLRVIPRPRAALVLCGDELAASGVPAPGMVRDSLGPQLPAYLARMAVQVVALDRCPDTLDAHVQAISQAAGQAEVVLTTGGTAAGPVDHLHSAIEACGGRMAVDTVAVRPGHPMLAATLDDATPGSPSTWVVGLPGNPQSAVVTLLTLAAPILARLAGEPALPDLLRVACAEAVAAPDHEDRLVLGSLVDDTFRPGTHLGSAMLRGLAAATGFAVLPPKGVAAGGSVRWLPLPR